MLGLLFIVLSIFFFGGIYAFLRRRKSRHEAIAGTLTVFAQAPTSPAQPATAFMFPGRSEPPDPDPRPTAIQELDTHGPRALPPGIKKI
jgi:hypothetical protein